MRNCKETDLFWDQAVLVIWELLLRLLNDYWWLIRCDRSKLPTLWWGMQGAVETVACSQMIECNLGACQLLWEHECLKVPWGAPLFLPCYQEHVSTSCRGGRSALLRVVAACMLKLENADVSVLMGSMKPSGWDVPFSCQNKTGNLLSPSGESVRCSSVRSVA